MHFIYLLSGLVLGILLGWFLSHARSFKALTAESNAKSIAERLAAEREEQILKMASELENVRDTASKASEKAVRLETELDAVKKQLGERTEFLEKAEQLLSKTFSELSGQALKGAQTQFLELAREGFNAQRQTGQMEMDKRKEAVEAMIKPVSEALGKLQINLNALETSREGAYQALKEQVGAIIQGQAGLHRETSRLVQALRTPTGRGQWGELQLKRVVEMAGMIEHCDFITQETHHDDDGNRLRPDVIVKLPGGRCLVIDAKSPMDAYLQALECEDEEEKKGHLAHHARQVRSHLLQLGSREYGRSVPGSPEFVVLFLPSEAFFQAALEADSALIQCGVEKNVIMATPTTLIALLRAVSYGWRQELVADNARKISEAGNELYDRCTTLGNHFSKLGVSLQKSVESYNNTLASFETRVLPGARTLKNLGIAGKKELPELSEIAVSPRTPREMPAKIDRQDSKSGQ